MSRISCQWFDWSEIFERVQNGNFKFKTSFVVFVSLWYEVKLLVAKIYNFTTIKKPIKKIYYANEAKWVISSRFLLSIKKSWSINKSVLVYFFLRKNSLIFSVFNLFLCKLKIMLTISIILR